MKVSQFSSDCQKILQPLLSDHKNFSNNPKNFAEFHLLFQKLDNLTYM